MLEIRRPLVILLIALMIAALGCIQKTITDKKIEASMQAYVDAPPEAPAGSSQAIQPRVIPGAPTHLNYEDYLTAEERATIESFEVYRNVIKVQLVQGTDKSYWETVGRKIVRAFAMACRDATYLDVTYTCELRIKAKDDEGEYNTKVGDIAFSNRSERIVPQLYNPTRKQRQ